MTDVRSRQRAGWRGVQGRSDEQLTCRYGNHFPELALLVEIVFIWPRERDAALEERILASARPELPDTEGLTRWHVFGMDMRVDASLALDACTAEPGRQELVFRNRRRLVEQRFCRHGMVKEWFKQSVPEWLQGRVPRAYRILGRRNDTQRGHAIARLHGERRRGNLRELLRGPREYRSAAWLCPTGRRLYTVQHVGIATPTRKQAATPAPSLGCCSGMRVEL